MTKDKALRLALEALESTGENNGYHGVTQYFDETMVDQAIAAIKAALEAKDEPVGSFMTRVQAIDFLLKMRPQTEPTEKQIIATIDAYSALFGDMIKSPTPPHRKPLTLEQLREHWKVAKVLDMTDAEIDFADYVLIARDVEALHGIKGEA